MEPLVATIDRMRFPPQVSARVDVAGHAWLSLELEDIDHPGCAVRLVRKAPKIPPESSALDVALILRQEVIALFVHEVNEWVTLDGTPVVDPHPE